MLFTLIPLLLPAFVLHFPCIHDKILYQVNTNSKIENEYPNRPGSIHQVQKHTIFIQMFQIALLPSLLSFFLSFVFCLLLIYLSFLISFFFYFLIHLADTGKLQGKATVSRYNLKYISGFTSYNMQILLSCYDICICCTLKCQNFIKHEANILRMLLIFFQSQEQGWAYTSN